MFCQTCGNDAVYSLSFQDNSTRLSCANHFGAYRQNRLYKDHNLIITTERKEMLSSEFSSNLIQIHGMMSCYISVLSNINSSIIDSEFMSTLSKCKTFFTKQLVAILDSKDDEISENLKRLILNSETFDNCEMQGWVYPDIWIDLENECEIMQTELESMKKSFYEKVMIDFYLNHSGQRSIFSMINFYEERKDNCIKTLNIGSDDKVLIRAIRFGRTVENPCVVNLNRKNLMLAIGGFINGETQIRNCYLVNTEHSCLISMFTFTNTLKINYTTIGINVNMSVYLIGPQNNNSEITDIWMLNLLTQELKKLTTTNISLTQISGIHIDDNIFFTGCGTNSIHKYSITNNELTIIAPSVKPEDEIASLLKHKQKIYYIAESSVYETNKNFQHFDRRAIHESFQDLISVESQEVESGIIFRDYSLINFLNLENFTLHQYDEIESIIN